MSPPARRWCRLVHEAREAQMKTWRVAAVLSLLGLAGCAYENPGAPASLPVDSSAPSQLTLASSGGSTTTGNSTVTARVQNSSGAALANVVVTFATTRGTISPTQAATGANGSATAVLATTETADVTAIVGALSAHTLVAPSTTTSPTPPATAATFLNVSPNGTTGVPLAFSVSSSASGPWSWSFGDGVNAQSTEFSTTHAYGRAGVYTASVSGSGTSAGNATITVTDP